MSEQLITVIKLWFNNYFGELHFLILISTIKPWIKTSKKGIGNLYSTEIEKYVENLKTIFKKN